MIDIVKEVNRLPGYKPSGDIISGQVVKLVDSITIKAYDGSGEPLGFALDDTKVIDPTMIPTTKLPSGFSRIMMDKPSGEFVPTGVFYSEINRGGLVSVGVNGGVYNLLDDGRGSPFVTTDTYNVGAPAYVNASGLITADSNNNANPKVGIIMKAPTDGVLQIKAII